VTEVTDRGEGTPATELLQDFVNTREPQVGADALGDPAALTAWLERRGLAPAGTRLGAHHLELATSVREGLREVFMSNAGHEPDRLAVEGLNRVLAEFPVSLRLDGDSFVLEATAPDPLAGFLAQVADAIRQCHEDGTWQRLKVCARDTCRWAFYDASRNKVRRWCSMAGCGNHVKMKRAYARRVGSDGRSG
jgi:predicted RNA-binding Zn ribbon-like protein